MTKIKVIKPYKVLKAKKKPRKVIRRKKKKQLKEIVTETEVDMRLGQSIAEPLIKSGNKRAWFARFVNPKKALEKTVAAMPTKKIKGAKYAIGWVYSHFKKFGAYGLEEGHQVIKGKEYQTTEDKVKDTIPSERAMAEVDEAFPVRKNVSEMLEERQHKPINKKKYALR